MYDIFELLNQNHELIEESDEYTNFGLCWRHKDTSEYLIQKGRENELSYLIDLGIDSHLYNGLGFNSTTNTWYGWSNDEIYGFTIGSTIKKGDRGYQIQNEEELIAYLSNKTIDKYILEENGYSILCEKEYCIHSHCEWKAKEFVKDELKLYFEKCTDFNFEPESHFIPYGRGEWIAETIEDSKQMAIDFKDGLSLKID